MGLGILLLFELGIVLVFELCIVQGIVLVFLTRYCNGI